MTDETSYKSALFIVPSRILSLPNLSFAYLKVFETVFQFWNHGKACFLSNQMIMKRTGISSSSTVKLALAYFEKHGEIKRIIENGKRYLIQPELRIETDQEVNSNDVDNSKRVADGSAGGGRSVAPPPADGSAHNINNINIKNLNKSFYEKSKIKEANKQKHAFADSMDKNASEKSHIEEHEKTKKDVPDYLKGISGNKYASNQQCGTANMIWGPGHPGWESLHRN